MCFLSRSWRTHLDIDFTGYVSIGFAKIISFCHPRYYKITNGRRSQKVSASGCDNTYPVEIDSFKAFASL